MKNLKKLLAGLAVFACACSPSFVRAQSTAQQFYALRWNNLTNFTGSIATNTTATVFAYSASWDGTNGADGTSVFPIYRGRGISFWNSANCGAGTNATVTVKFDLTPDYTNWTFQGSGGSYTFTANGTNANSLSFTNLPATQFDNAVAGRIYSVTGGTGTNSVTNNWGRWAATP